MSQLATTTNGIIYPDDGRGCTLEAQATIVKENQTTHSGRKGGLDTVQLLIRVGGIRFDNPLALSFLIRFTPSLARQSPLSVGRTDIVSRVQKHHFQQSNPQDAANFIRKGTQ